MRKSTSTGVVHGIAECITCGWSNDNYKNALATGAKHADSYPDHEVHVEQAIVVIYNKGAS